jgi:glutamate-1-semialdehyde 2,1-aminomutase
VIVEPLPGNMGLVEPSAGFLAGLRAECDRVGALLIFDEVISGFRVGRGGYQAVCGVVPDITCFGKVIGGGLPIGAIGGRRDVMENLSPLGTVFHAGTLAGNPLATAAGLAALSLLDDGAYDFLSQQARRLGEGLRQAFAAAGVPAVVPVVGTLVGLHLAAAPATNFDEAKTTDEAFFGRFFHAMLDEGVALAPGAYEVLFPGLAHTDSVIDQIIDAAGRAARRAARAA